MPRCRWAGSVAHLGQTWGTGSIYFASGTLGFSGPLLASIYNGLGFGAGHPGSEASSPSSFLRLPDDCPESFCRFPGQNSVPVSPKGRCVNPRDWTRQNGTDPCSCVFWDTSLAALAAGSHGLNQKRLCRLISQKEDDTEVLHIPQLSPRQDE